MDHLPPPPPYTETDIYSTAGRSNSGSGSVATPTTSHADDESPVRVVSDYEPSSAGESTIYTPPYTPDGSIHLHGSGIPDNWGEEPVSAAASYFASRPVYQTFEEVLLLHTVNIATHTKAEELTYPEPEDLWIARDVTHQDWATFVNYLIPRHIDLNNGDVADRKLKAELIDERMHRLTLGAKDRSMVDLEQVDAQLDPLRQPTAPNAYQPHDFESIVSEWNEGFFSSRMVHIDLDLIPTTSQTPTMPGAWTDHPADETNEPGAGEGSRSFNPNNAGRGWGPWIRADNSGFHMGRSFLSADNNGFRMMGRNGLRADNNGFRIGNMLVADSNGFKLGGLVADSNGLRVGGRLFGTTSQNHGPVTASATASGQETRGINQENEGDQQAQLQHSHGHRSRHSHHRRGSGHFHRGRPPGRYPDHGRRSRSSSVSSSSSLSSYVSEASIGSLPDYENLESNQLPLLKQSLQGWLNNPQQALTKEKINGLKTELQEASKNARYLDTKTTGSGAGKGVGSKALRADIKALVKEFKVLQRAQRAEARAIRKEKYDLRKKARKEKRMLKKNLKREMKGKGRARDQPVEAQAYGFGMPSMPPMNVPWTRPGFNGPMGLAAARGGRGTWGMNSPPQRQGPIFGRGHGDHDKVTSPMSMPGAFPGGNTRFEVPSPVSAHDLWEQQQHQQFDEQQQQQQEVRAADATELHRNLVARNIELQRIYGQAQRVRGEAQQIRADAKKLRAQACMVDEETQRELELAADNMEAEARVVESQAQAIEMEPNTDRSLGNMADGRRRRESESKGLGRQDTGVINGKGK
jgi:hypothetical protein